MLQDFKVKTLFEDQFHDRHQFTFHLEGDQYQGIFHDGEMQWFYPQPNNKLNEDDFQNVEIQVYDLMTNHLHQDFKVKPLFEDQFSAIFRWSDQN